MLSRSESLGLKAKDENVSPSLGFGTRMRCANAPNMVKSISRYSFDSQKKAGRMENKIARHAFLAIILLAVCLAPSVSAQQTGTTGKPAEKKATPSAAPSAGSTAEVTEPSKKVVIKVGKAEVTQKEIDFLISNMNSQAQQALAANGRKPLGDEYVKVLLLSQKAENDHLESDPELHERMELQRTQMLAQAEYEKMSNEVKVSPDDIGKYYTTHQSEFETAQVREFVVRKKPDGAKEGTPGMSAVEAQATADKIRKALAAGTDPATVAKESAVANVVMIDQEPRTIKRGQLLASLDKAAFELKEGQVSDVLDTPQAIVFLQIVGRHVQEQKDAASDIENKLRQEKLEAAVGDLRNKTNVWMDEDYFKPRTTLAVPPKTTPTDPPPKDKP